MLAIYQNTQTTCLVLFFTPSTINTINEA